MSFPTVVTHCFLPPFLRHSLALYLTLSLCLSPYLLNPLLSFAPPCSPLSLSTPPQYPLFLFPLQTASHQVCRPVPPLPPPLPVSITPYTLHSLPLPPPAPAKPSLRPPPIPASPTRLSSPNPSLSTAPFDHISAHIPLSTSDHSFLNRQTSHISLSQS